MRNGFLKQALPALVLMAAVPALAMPLSAAAQSDISYQQPPAPIAQILDAKPTPGVGLSPDRKTLVLQERTSLPSIEELSAPMLRLAGYRINPANNGPANSRVSWLTGLSFQPVAGGEARAVAGLPAHARLTNVTWSPDGAAVAFLRNTPDGLELWTADVASAQARRLTNASVNATLGNGYDWLPDSSGLLVRSVPSNRRAAPDVTRPPAGLS